jgi:N-acetylneuraminate synthase
VITSDSVRSVRPGFGLAPKYHASILGAKVARDVHYGTPMSFSDLVKSNGQ